MNSPTRLLTEFEALTAEGFPLGLEGAEVLDQVERISRLIEQAKTYYKAQLTKNPNCVPGWTLRPGAIRRSLGDPAKVWDRLSDTLTSEQFMAAITIRVVALREIWARVAGVSSTRAKAAFDELLDDLMVTLPTAPTLVRSKRDQYR